jgi:hypothetical protein
VCLADNEKNGPEPFSERDAKREVGQARDALDKKVLSAFACAWRDEASRAHSHMTLTSEKQGIFAGGLRTDYDRNTRRHVGWDEVSSGWIQHRARCRWPLRSALSIRFRSCGFELLLLMSLELLSLVQRRRDIQIGLPRAREHRH